MVYDWLLRNIVYYLALFVKYPCQKKKRLVVSFKTIQSVVFLGSEREFFISDCLLSGYLELVTRYEPITGMDEEAMVFGLLAAVHSYRFREIFIFK